LDARAKQKRWEERKEQGGTAVFNSRSAVRTGTVENLASGGAIFRSSHWLAKGAGRKNSLERDQASTNQCGGQRTRGSANMLSKITLGQCTF